MTAQPEEQPRPAEIESSGGWSFDSDDADALQFLLGAILLLVGAWIIAPPLALLLIGATLMIGVARNR